MIIWKELSFSIDSKNFAKKSKEYSSLGSIVSIARDYLKFDTEKDLEQIIHKNSDADISEMAQKI